MAHLDSPAVRRPTIAFRLALTLVPRRFLVLVAIGVVLATTPLQVRAQPGPTGRAGTAEPQRLLSVPEGDTTYPAVSPPRLLSHEEIRALLTAPISPATSGIEVAPPATASVSPSAPSLGTSFEGVGPVSTPFPPDGGLAAGQLYLVQVTNGGIAYFTKDGQAILQTSLGAFFANANGVFDPRVLYDQGSGRFFVAASTFANQVLLAVSSSANPLDGFCTYTFDSPNVPDFPMLGVSPNAVTISTNQFDNASPPHFLGQDVWFLTKSQLLSCTSVNFNSFSSFLDCAGFQNFSLQPAHMFGGPDVQYMAAVASGNSVTVWAVSQPVGAIGFSRVCQPVNRFSPPPLAIEPGGGVPLDTLGTRLDHLIFVNNRLFMSHAGAGGSCVDGPAGLCSALFLTEMDVGAFPTITNVLDTPIFSNGYYFWQPNIAVDANLNVGITFSFTSAPFGRFPGVAFTSIDSAGNLDPNLGVLVEGQANYQAVDPTSGLNRWGDYFGASPDPCTNRGTWHEHEYAGTSNQWRTRIGNVFGGSPPANDVCTSAIPIGSFPFTDVRDATFATFSVSDPFQTCALGGPGQNNSSAWYEFTAPGNGTVHVDTFGSSYDTVLSVGQGICSDFSELACSDDSSGTAQSSVNVGVQCNAAYGIDVTEFALPSCGNQTLTLNATFTPTNACSAAISIPPEGGTFVGNTCGVSTLAGSCGGGGAPEQVYTWVPNTSGTATIDTCGSGTAYDTLIYMVSGNCGSGTELGCNNDACTNATGGVRASRITPTVAAGQTYFIVVDGFGSSQGNFSLHVAPPTTTTTTTSTTTLTSSTTSTTVRVSTTSTMNGTTSTTATPLPTTTSTTTTSVTSTTACGNGIVDPGEQCDPGAPGSSNSYCCTPGCRVNVFRVGLPCGPTRALDACELPDTCNSEGRCTRQAKTSDVSCRDAFTNGPCDAGDNCDGVNPSCPTTNANDCTGAPEQPPAGTNTVTVTCRAPATESGKHNCSAQGFSVVGRSRTATVTGHAAGPQNCNGKPVTKGVTASLRKAGNSAFLQRRLSLTLNQNGRRYLKQHGSLDVCVLVTVKFRGAVLSRTAQTVVLHR